MLSNLSNIDPTDQEKVICPFYFKIGACRHGDSCTRSHPKPSQSQTVIIPHMYSTNFDHTGQSAEDMASEAQKDFEDFYEDVFFELIKYGEIEDILVCDNTAPHMVGNLYVKYYDEEGAGKALAKLAGRFFAGKVLQAEYSPVTNFKDGICCLFKEGACQRGGLCNFLHPKFLPVGFKESRMDMMYKQNPEYLEKKKQLDIEKGIAALKISDDQSRDKED